LLPPDVREWLPENHLAWFVIGAVEEMDLGAFYAAYRQDGRARPAYDPAMMVALLLYAYARGTRSSRVIERACLEDVAFRVIAAQQRPDHATIARFVERHQDALAGLFGEVLTLCARAGLAQVGVIAVDGTKVAANASRNENLDYQQRARNSRRSDRRRARSTLRSSGETPLHTQNRLTGVQARDRRYGRRPNHPTLFKTLEGSQPRSENSMRQRDYAWSRLAALAPIRPTQQ
jgi:transposase